MSTELPDGVSVEDARASADMFVRVGALVNLMRDYLNAPEGTADERSAWSAFDEYVEEMLDDRMVAGEAILYLAGCIATVADDGVVDRWIARNIELYAAVIREAGD